MTTLDEMNQQQQARNAEFKRWVAEVLKAVRARGYTVTEEWSGGGTSGPFVLPNLVFLTLRKPGTADWRTSLSHLYMDTFRGRLEEFITGNLLRRWSEYQALQVGQPAAPPAPPPPPGQVSTTAPAPAPAEQRPSTTPTVTEPPPVPPPAPAPEAQRAPAAPSPAAPEPAAPAPSLEVATPAPAPPGPADVQAAMIAEIGRQAATWDQWGWAYQRVTGEAAPSPESRGVMRRDPMPEMTATEWWDQAFGGARIAVPLPAPAPGAPVPIPDGAAAASLIEHIIRLLQQLLRLVLAGEGGQST